MNEGKSNGHNIWYQIVQENGTAVGSVDKIFLGKDKDVADFRKLVLKENRDISHIPARFIKVFKSKKEMDNNEKPLNPSNIMISSGSSEQDGIGKSQETAVLVVITCSLSSAYLVSAGIEANAHATINAFNTTILDSSLYIVEDLQLDSATTIFSTDNVGIARSLMLRHEFSQLPVVDQRRRIVGLVTLDSIPKDADQDEISKHMFRFPASSSKKYKIVTPDTKLLSLDEIFKRTKGVFVTDESGNHALAVITKEDVDTFLERQGLLK